MDGFSPVSPPKIFWNSRKRSAISIRSLENCLKDENPTANNQTKTEKTEPMKVDSTTQATEEDQTKEDPSTPLSERRKSLFQPLEPTKRKRTPAEMLLPPPDFDSAAYPKGWLIGKKRKLVNVDVVESMRRIAVQEMNRKDREIDGLNEQLEEDARFLEHLQLQLLEERSKRTTVERENAMLHDQISMLMTMLDETQNIGDEEEEPPADDA